MCVYKHIYIYSNIHTYIYIDTYIYIYHHHHHHVVLLAWISLTFTIHLYYPSLPEGLPGYILYQHRAVLNWLKLVFLPLLVHVKESTGVYHL